PEIVPKPHGTGSPSASRFIAAAAAFIRATLACIHSHCVLFIFFLLLRLPVGDLARGFFLAHRIGLLHAARQLLALAHRAVDLLVGEPAPALLGVRLVARPAGFDGAPVHVRPSRCVWLRARRKAGNTPPRRRKAARRQGFFCVAGGGRGSPAEPAVTTGYFRNTDQHTRRV